jgi:predicted NUDIX family NTP pyrophosphohydrolase
MATKEAFGLLMFRERDTLEFFLVHPGGPFFAKKREGFWTIPKGEANESENPLDAAVREFFEETGLEPLPPFISLGKIKQKGGKTVHAWASKGDWDESQLLKSNTFKIEWPPRSGKFQEFPEIDQWGWFPIEEAKKRINHEQSVFLERLLQHLHSKP